MRYFTLDRWLKDQDLDADSSANFGAVGEYQSYLVSVMDKLPEDFVRMLQTICIHDAKLRELDVDALVSRVTLRLDAGDVTMREGRNVKLHYLAVRRVLSTSDPEKGLPGPHGYGDLGNDEIEVLEDGEYEHRILFSSGIELALFPSGSYSSNQCSSRPSEPSLNTTVA